MKLKVVTVDLEIPPSTKRWALRVGIPLGVLLSGGAIAWAAGLHTWNQGDTLNASDLNGNFAELQARLAGTADCPMGYTLQGASGAGPTICKNAASDEVVKVGSGPSSFWIDRYEASVWDNAITPATQYGAGVSYPGSFPASGQWTTALYAISKAGVTPSANLTWFQANEVCRASGKRLPTGSEWLSAARGTADPGSTGTAPACNVSGSGPTITGTGTSCASNWGAQDMIGSLWEWTDEWYATLGSTVNGTTPWPTGYGGDGTWNITNAVNSDGSGAGSPVTGLPAAGMRGGSWELGSRAGVFAFALIDGPSNWYANRGFRCVLPGR